MKFAIALGAIFLVCLIVSSEAAATDKPVTTKPAAASKDVKDAIKAAKENQKKCAKACPSSYDPICAHDPANTSFKPRTFGNQCVLDTHNCEQGTKLVMKSKGECAGSDGVRVS